MRFDAVVFDLDGTLTESGPGIIASARYALEKMERPILSNEELRAFVGPPLKDSFMRFCGMSEDEAALAVKTYRERHVEIGWKEARVYEGILSLLISLKRAGVTICLASSKPLALCEKTLDYFGLLGFFDKLSAPDENNSGVGKDILIRNALPDEYANACMVGDRKFDMDGARKAGVFAVGVGYGYGSQKELEDAGAQTYCETVNELTDFLLDGLPRQKGFFITFEGSDGCGKSTQLKLLAEYLRLCGAKVITSREPGGCAISERIRNVLLDVKSMGMTDECEALLFAASRAQHVNDVIAPALNRGEIVLCDRFADSSYAYQGAGRGLGSWVEEINRRAVSGCTPDLTLFFDLSPAEALKRRYQAAEADRIELANVEFMDRVYNAFQEMQAKNPDRIIRLDATGKIEQIQDRVRQIIINHLTNVARGRKMPKNSEG